MRVSIDIRQMFFSASVPWSAFISSTHTERTTRSTIAGSMLTVQQSPTPCTPQNSHTPCAPHNSYTPLKPPQTSSWSPNKGLHDRWLHLHSMYKSKFTGCKSIQPLRSVFGGSTFCSNDCSESLWVGLDQLYTVRW